jgi:hypothetical protein
MQDRRWIKLLRKVGRTEGTVTSRLWVEIL